MWSMFKEVANSYLPFPLFFSSRYNLKNGLLIPQALVRKGPVTQHVLARDGALLWQMAVGHTALAGAEGLEEQRRNAWF